MYGMNSYNSNHVNNIYDNLMQQRQGIDQQLQNIDAQRQVQGANPSNTGTAQRVPTSVEIMTAGFTDISKILLSINTTLADIAKGLTLNGSTDTPNDTKSSNLQSKPK